MRATGGIGLLAVAALWMVVPPPDRAELVLCFILSLMALAAGWLMARAPEQLIDLETARDRAVPPRGAD